MQPDFHLRKPIEALTPQELYAELLDDAVLLRATPLSRAIAAYEKIAKAWNTNADAVYLRVIEDKAIATGSRLMPIS